MPPRKKTLASVTESTAALLQERQNEIAREAYEMRRKGMDWWDIAAELKITPAQAKERIAAGIKLASELVDQATKSELLQMEVARLDQLQRAVWADAMAGDVRAVAAARGIIADRAKLLRLDVDDNVTLQQNTVVVTGTSTAYVEALRSIQAYDPAADPDAFAEDVTG